MWAYGNGRFVTVSTDTSSIYRSSTDGVNWTLGQKCRGDFICASTRHLWQRAFCRRGANGISARQRHDLDQQLADGYLHAERRRLTGWSGGTPTYIAVDNSGAIYRCTDWPLLWTSVTSGTTNALNSVAYWRGVFTAVGASGNRADFNRWRRDVDSRNIRHQPMPLMASGS